MLEKLVTRASLKSAAGATVFGRGEAYCAAGAVSRLRAQDDRISARVEGSETYQVELRDDDGDLGYDCSCPHAADGNFCKHCVAVGLAWLAESPPAPESGRASGRRKRPDPWRVIKDYLATRSKDHLIESLLEVAQRDDRLYRSLLLNAKRAGGGGNAAQAFRQAIDDATRVGRFVDWRESGAFAQDIDQVVDSMAELLKPGTAAVLVELAEYAIEKVENALEQVDDSGGATGEVVNRLGDLHMKACALAKPDPIALAGRLFRLETTLPFGVCSFDAATYRHALGPKGLRRYRELAEAEWRKLKPRDANAGHDHHEWRISRIMEGLAKARGDVEELVAIKSRNLSSSLSYLEIAETWAKARKPDKALEWAERGLKAFPDRPDNRLRDFLVAIYLRRKRNDEALQLTWIQFEERPCLELYVKLHGIAHKLGVWPEQRQRALVRVAESVARVSATTSRWKPKAPPADFSLRVEIALWEDDLDSAWAAANEGGCARHLRLALAGRLEAARPDDAVGLYRQVVPAIVEETSNAAYAEAIRIIRKTGALMSAQGQSRSFGDYLAELRVRFKPKRNFIKLLDAFAAPQVRPSPGRQAFP